MKKVSFVEESLPLIVYEADKKIYSVNQETLNFIKSVPSPMGVIGVAGMYRTGKSYLLNRMLLNRSDGFGVGATVNACTKGLWVWGTPIKGQTADGQTCNILVIDSEGIGALDEDSAHDTRIFSLTILLSSIFIYNSSGSIDENAIQNLSLVVNITKNIQFRANDNEEMEAEDYANYFPSFIWIIRDFALQLVDQDGEPISSKEYLERSLASQPGFSDDVEQKNRIRRLLTTFFPERDCVTMVRPLLNETNLQNLDKMDLTKLRPEFYEQVLTLRKKILSRMRPKMLNNKNLNGDMYAGLMVSYVKAINEGSVPNIENAWTYILREQNEKAIEETMVSYERMITDQLAKKLPLTYEDLKLQHRMVVQTTIDLFKEKCMDKDNSEEFIVEMKKKMKEKFSKLKLQNEKESYNVCQSFIKKEWAPIEKKLKLNEYKHFFEFERDLNLFHQFLIEHGPNTVNRETIFLDFLKKNLSEGATLFIKNLLNENEIHKTVSTEFKTKYEKEVKELRDELLKEKNNSINKVSSLEKQRLELEGKEEELKKSNQQLKESKEKLELDLKNKLNDEQKKFQINFNELQSKYQKLEHDFEEKTREKVLKEKDSEKDFALAKQRILNLEQSLQEAQQREKDWETKFNNIKLDLSNQIKEINIKTESEKRSMTVMITEMKEKITDYESKVTNESENWVIEKENYKKREEGFKKSIIEANQTIDTLMKQINEFGLAEKERVTKLRKDYEEEIDFLKQKLGGFESNLKEKDDSLKTHRSTNEKTTAVLQQKCEFLESELQSVKQQLIDAKKAHDATIRAFEMSQPDNKSQISQKEILEMKETHMREKKLLENELITLKKQHGLVVDQLNEKINELELKLKVLENDYNKDTASLKEALDQIETARQKLASDLKNADSQKLKLVKETEERFNTKIKELEENIENNARVHNQEMKDMQAKSELALKQLREFYESEKQRLEKKSLEEKEKYDRKMSMMVEEYETRIREETVTYEEDNDNLRQELKEHELQSQSLIQQYEHELDLSQRSVENLEKLLKEAKDNLLKQEEMHKAELDNLNNQFNTERNTLLERIENLVKDINGKEKELIGLKQRLEIAEQNMGTKDELLDKQKAEWLREKADLNDQLEELRKKLQELSDEYLDKKINYEKNAALLQQQNDFLKQKLDELQKQLEQTIQRYEDSIRRLKEELFQEHNLRLNALQEERNAIEQKHEKLKKSAKDNDSNKEKRLAELERDRAILLEKNENLQNRLSDLESKYNNETHHYNLQISNIRDNQESDKKPLLADLEKYRALCIQLENDKAEILALYDKDRVLWEGKFNFLQQQREQAKNDLADAIKKFDATLQNLQKARSNDKNGPENSLTDMLLTIEKKYQTQISELAENHNKALLEMEEKNKKLEKEMKNMRDKLLLDSHGKLGSQILNEKKINEYMQNEKRYITEIENIKTERDERIIEYQNQLDKDREILKNKLYELEDKYKESELKRSTLLFEHEKERAKWYIEKEHVLNQKNEIQDSLLKLEKKKEILLRENEKLKNDYKNSKKNNAMFQSNVQRNLNLSQHISDVLKKSPSNSRFETSYTVTSKISSSDKENTGENK